MSFRLHHVAPPQRAAEVPRLLLLLVIGFGIPLSFSAETPATHATPVISTTTRPAERGVFEFKALTPVPASATTKKQLRVDRWLIGYQEDMMFVFALAGRDRIVALDVHTSLAEGHLVTTYDGAKSATWMTPPGVKRPADKRAALVQARFDAALGDISAHRKAAGTKGLDECAWEAMKCAYQAQKARLSGAPDEIVEALIQCVEAVDVCLPSPGSQVAFNSVVIICTEELDNPRCQELCSDSTFALESWCQPEIGSDGEPVDEDDTEADTSIAGTGDYRPAGPDEPLGGGYVFKYCAPEPTHTAIVCSVLIDDEGNEYGEVCTSQIVYEMVCY